MQTFVEKLKHAQEVSGSMMIVGLDFDEKKVPGEITELFHISPDAAIEKFNRTIVEVTAERCCGWKPNLAFYESQGRKGWKALERTVRYIRQICPNHVIILDGKRNDIGNTAEQYAAALYGIGGDAVTWNPYMGNETAQPFFDLHLGVFGLCLTSNPGSADYQSLPVQPAVSADQPIMPVYMHVAIQSTGAFGASGNYGLVVGATKPAQLAEIRAAVGPDIPLLIPGLKTQGGEAAAIIAANNGGLAVVNVSRSVLYASREADWAQAAKAEAQKTNDELNELRATA